MNSLITYLNEKLKETGHKPTMPELRELIESDSLKHKRITEELKSLYRKTFQYEQMQQVLNKPIELN